MLIHTAKIINEGKSFTGSVLIKDGNIEKIFREEVPEKILKENTTIEAEGLWLIPGAIDEHVHFREPGLTEKADIESESRAAVTGGVTSFMDMPNCKPQTTTLELVEQKCEIAEKKSLANYSFYLGATKDNIAEIKKIDKRNICGVKLFMGSSTGNMLVDETEKLSEIFAESPVIIATHNEDTDIINQNAERLKSELGEDIPVKYHPAIRSEEACYRSTAKAVELAKKHNAKLHVMHISTAKELSLFDNKKPLSEKRITAETCPQYLLFSDEDYERLGAKIKCNPAIKTANDRNALQKALTSNIIDTIGSDHAPHLPKDKEGNALTATSGMPLIQFSLLAMLDLVKKGTLTRETLVEKMCHNPAIIYNISKRGFIRKGYRADLVLIDPNKQTIVNENDIQSKCGWSPFCGMTFNAKITHTIVNGNIVYENGEIHSEHKGERLTFDR